MWSDNLVFGSDNGPLFYFISVFWIYCFMIANTVNLPASTVKVLKNFPEVVLEELNSFSFILCPAGCFSSLQKIFWNPFVFMRLEKCTFSAIIMPFFLFIV